VTCLFGWSRVLRLVSLVAVLPSLVSLGGCETAEPAEPAPRGDLTVPTADPFTARTFVLDTIGFTRKDANGHVPGFDVDNRVSQEGDVETCDKGDFTAPDGTPGIDNQFANLVPIIELSGLKAFEGLLQSSIDNGGILLMLDVSDVQDWRNDTQIKAVLRAGYGHPLLGTDGLLLSGQTFHLSTRSPELVLPNARIVDGILRADAFDGQLPIHVFEYDYTLDMKSAQIVASVVSDSRLEAGLLGGGITLSSIEQVAKTAAIDQPDLYETITALVAGVGDLAKDPLTGACTQISATLSFTATTAYLFPGAATAAPAP
jgi:hypothetical protein